MPVDPKTLPQDAETLKRMLVDVTAQLDRTERLLRQLLQAKTGAKASSFRASSWRFLRPKRGGRSLSRKRRKTIPTKSRRSKCIGSKQPQSRAGGKPLPQHLEA